MAYEGGLTACMEKRLWMVSLQEIYEGHFYVVARTAENARDLAWTHFGHGGEPRSVGHGYLVSASPVGDPEALSEAMGELCDDGPDADEDDPAFAQLEQVPKHWDP